MVDVWCGGCPFLLMVWWMSGVVDVWCGGCPVWWMSGVVDVLFYTWCGGCPVWWMSGVVDVLFYTRCGGCLVGGMSVWWMLYNRARLLFLECCQSIRFGLVWKAGSGAIICRKKYAVLHEKVPHNCL